MNSEFTDPKPNYYTTYIKNHSINHPKKVSDSPCGIGAFGPSAFIEY